jgi:hypothetical protein
MSLEILPRVLFMEYAAVGGVAVLLGGVLMLVLSLALVWIPLVGPLCGPLLAGMVGGYFSGGVRRALVAAIVPAILQGVFIWWLDTRESSLAGIFVAVGIFPLVLAGEVALWVGALLGGLIAHGRHHAPGAHTA